MRPILVYDGYSTSSPSGAKAYYMGVTSYTQLGNNIGVCDLGTFAGNAARVSRRCNIVQYQSSIYVLHNRAIKKMNSDGTWSTLASLSNAYTAIDFLNQMMMVNVGGNYYLAGIYASSSSGGVSTYIRGFTYNLQTGDLTISGEVIISSSGGSSGSPTAQAVGGIYYYDSALYILWGNGTSNGTQIVTYNILAASLTLGNTYSFNLSAGGQPTADMCIFNGELYLCAYNTGTVAFLLYKLVGGVFINIATIASASAWSAGRSKPCIFTDGISIFTVALLNTGTWKMYKTTSSLVTTDITANTISGFTSQDVDSRFKAVVDQHANPTNPDIILIYQADTAVGNINRFYKFNGELLPLDYLGSSGEAGATISIANSKEGGGEMMYVLNEPNIQIEGQITESSTPGNSKIPFRIYETTSIPSGTPVEVRFYFTRTRGTPVTPCTLANPSPSGTIVDNNILRGIIAGSGQLYYVDWRSALDNVVGGTVATVVPFMSGILT